MLHATNDAHYWKHNDEQEKGSCFQGVYRQDTEANNGQLKLVYDEYVIDKFRVVQDHVIESPKSNSGTRMS